MRESAPPRSALAAVILIAVVLAAFRPVFSNGFVDHDDFEYILKNPRVSGGITSRAAAWAFTTTFSGNWIPLTWLSHQLDVSLFGLDPRGHHAVGLFLHAANTVLLLLLVFGISGALLPASFSAALFALHPLHVEPVVWASERKELLATFFALLALLAYVNSTRTASRRFYFLSLFCFTISLMCKAMWITLPLLLVLFEYWPLGRLEKVGDGKKTHLRLFALARDKLPFVALSFAFSIVAFAAQRQGGAVHSLASLSADLRVSNALVSYIFYLGQTFVPRGLCFFYPFPTAGISLWKSVLALAALAAISQAAWSFRRRQPWLLTGWLWYLVALLPVIGIVQIGMQARADRYTYVPLIGVFISFAFLLTALAGRRLQTSVLPAAMCAILVLLGFLSWRQTGYWHDSETLFRRGVAAVKGNWYAHNYLGDLYADRGDLATAAAEYRMALGQWPGYSIAHFNLGQALYSAHDLSGAEIEFRKAIESDPDLAAARRELGNVLLTLGRRGEALEQYRSAISLDPSHAMTRYNMGLALEGLGRLVEAAAAYEAALALDQGDLQARENLKRLRIPRRQPAR